jgi:DNA-binding response OmpR family regulator
VSGEKILILEDDVDVADIYARTLREEGNEVVVCVRFEDARRQLKVDPPDALLTDIRVGEYNGLQLAHLFRMGSPDGRVVVVSGYDDIVIRKEVSDLNARFFVKPVRLSELKAAFAARHAHSANPTRHRWLRPVRDARRPNPVGKLI